MKSSGSPAPISSSQAQCRPRILLLIKGLGLGGAEKLLCSTLPLLSQEYFDYHIGYLLPWKDALVPEIRELGFPVTCFNARRTFDLAALFRVCRFVRREKFDLIHSHLPVTGLMGRVAARVSHVRATVYTEHGCWDRLKGVTKFANRLTLSWDNLTIAVSREVADSLPHRSKSRLRTIRNGVSPATLRAEACGGEQVRRELGIPGHDFVVTSVANLSPVKNHELLLEAFAGLHDKRPDVSLLLVGQFRDRKDTLQELADSLGIFGKVQFLGPRNDVPRLLAASDAFALASKSEGLPMSLLEAMALGVPPVCSAVGGIPEVIVNEANGLLVKPGDSRKMADCFFDLADDFALRSKLGSAAAQTIHEEFNLARLVSTIEDEYRKLVRY